MLTTFESRLRSLFWSLGLIAGGVLLLLLNSNLLAAYEPWTQYLLGSVIAVGGLFFLGSFLRSQQHWWRLIPAWTLFAVALMFCVSAIPAAPGQLIAALLFLGLALAFGHIYLLRRNEYWWAIIPGGFMLVLSIVIALSSLVTRVETLGAVLFGGMGTVFFLLYGLGQRRQQWWALIPGSVLLLFGFFVLTSTQDSDSPILRWWPLLLILFGIATGWRNWRRSQTSKLAPPEPLPTPERSVIQPTSINSTEEAHTKRDRLGEYTQPAPGASVDLLPDLDEA